MAEVAGVEHELLLAGAALERRIGAPASRSGRGARRRRAARAAGTASTAARPRRRRRPRPPRLHAGQQDDADSRVSALAFSSRQNGETVHAGHDRRRARSRRAACAEMPRSASAALPASSTSTCDVLEGRRGAGRGILHRRRPATGAFVSPRIEMPVSTEGIGHWDQSLSEDLPRLGSRSAQTCRGGATAGRPLDPVRAEQTAQPSRRELRTEDGGRRGPRRRIEGRPVSSSGRGPPALVGQLVDLLLLDEERGAGEEAVQPRTSSWWNQP
jgi:hypothetical protein